MKRNAQPPFDPDKMIPAGRENFRFDEVARIFRCSLAHFWNLVEEGELVVPQENIDRAPSKGSILIPRKNLVDFIRRGIGGQKKQRGK